MQTLYKSQIMKRYYYSIFFFLAAIFFCISLILNLKPVIQGFSFVLLSGSIGMLIGNYLKLRKNISISAADKKLIISILFLSIVFCLIFLFVIDNLLIKQILICSLLLLSSIISIFIVFFRKQLNKEDRTI